MKLLSSTQTATVAGGSIVTTTAMSLATSISVAAGSTIAGFGGSAFLLASLPIGIVAGAVAYHEARSHSGNLGTGSLVGVIFSGTSTLVGNALGYKASAGVKAPVKPDIYCLNNDCNIS